MYLLIYTFTHGMNFKGVGLKPYKENQKFTPQHKKSANIQAENIQYSGLALKNLPPSISEPDLSAFLISKGLPDNCTNLKLRRSDKNTAVDIDGLDNDSCLAVIKNIHEKSFFNRTIYAITSLFVTI